MLEHQRFLEICYGIDGDAKVQNLIGSRRSILMTSPLSSSSLKITEATKAAWELEKMMRWAEIRQRGARRCEFRCDCTGFTMNSECDRVVRQWMRTAITRSSGIFQQTTTNLPQQMWGTSMANSSGPPTSTLFLG